MGFLKSIFGDYSSRELKSIYPIVDKIEALGDEYKALTDAELQAKTPEFKERLANGETLDDLLPEAFATVREAADRVLGLRPYRVQLIGGIVLGYIWSMIFDGILIKYNTSVILETKYGFWGLVILVCWQQIGYMMIIYIAGLQAVPEDMLEAARIDGANRWQTLWRVTIPNVMPSITICMFLSLTNGFKLFDQNLALTAGRPFQQLGNGETIKTTEMLALNIVNAFGTSGGGNRGVGQAKAVIFFIVVAAISIIQLQASRRKEVQQ